MLCSMVRRDPLKEALARLSEVRKDPSSDASLAELRRVLSGESSYAVAKAARIAGEAGLDTLAPDLVATFHRLLQGPSTSDPGCTAKTGLVEALLRLEHEDEEALLRGIHHVQLEPVRGGRVDTAADLRGACALGLARTSSPAAIVELAELLADPEPPARVSAARAIGNHGRPEGVPLLRHKVRAGDEEPRVLVECLLSLLHLDPEASLALAAGLLEPGSAVRAPPGDLSECAAIALGESRREEAFPLLRDWLAPAFSRGLVHTAVRALASLRRDEAFDHLLSLVREAEPPVAREAAAALAEQGDESLRVRIREAAAGRPTVARAAERVLAQRGE
jgi:HEAT repeat protein